MKRLGIALLFSLLIGAATAQIGGLRFPGPGTPHSAGGGVTGWCSLVPQQAGLLSCWPFDNTYTSFGSSGTATDPVGGKNAALTNVTANGSGPTTSLNNAGSFNGSTSKGNSTFVNLPSGSWTLSFWLKSSANVSARVMANDHTDADNKGLQVFVDNVNIVLNAATTAPGNINLGTTADYTNWAMWTWVYNGSTVNIYKNGTFIGTSASFTFSTTAPTNNLSFGYNPAYNGDFETMLFAGFGIWNVAFTGGEVATLSGL